jgi:leucyl-tRNA synthetase
VDGAKMSKSKGNVITPDEMASEYGIDILRLYLLFMAPFEDDVNWSDEAIAGIARYLQRFYRLFLDDTAKFSPQPINLEFDSLASGDRQIVRKTHQTIKKVTEDMDRFHFNTAIAAMMELANLLLPYKEKYGITPAFAESCRSLLMLMAPFAPHVTEEIWEGIGGSYSIHQLSWIAYNEAWTKEDMITIVVQVNGKVRDKFDAPVDVSEDDAKQMALAREKVRNYTDNKTIVKVVYVPGRLINIVVK